MHVERPHIDNSAGLNRIIQADPGSFSPDAEPRSQVLARKFYARC
jgi:hypothetical protein